ncbi:MAG TPA: extradiol dioxygenase [Blastocatellia bacterium]|nr:extradiol dioxygenase [Blastocatellia bacterium]
MFSGAHVIIYSKDAEADRAFIKDVLGFRSVDVGHGWLIFALPPAEVAVHPGDENDQHDLYLMCEDLKQTIAALDAKGIECTNVQETPWGILTSIKLPGGGQLGLYQPKHARP